MSELKTFIKKYTRKIESSRTLFINRVKLKESRKKTLYETSRISIYEIVRAAYYIRFVTH